MTKSAPHAIIHIGTKAQFVKMAPVLLELDRRGVPYRLEYTGQHSETFDELERAFGTRAADDCLVTSPEADTARGLLAWVVGFSRAAVARILSKKWRGARWGVVHGDTASALLSAVGFRLAGVPVAHVEAGLRSPRLLVPFPEELVRRLVSRISSLHLAPDARSAANLAQRKGKVVCTEGNTIRDSLRIALSRIAHDQTAVDDGYAIVSLHRSENLAVRSRLDSLLGEVVEASRTTAVRFVLHPVTRKRLVSTGWMSRLEAEPGIQLMARMDYVSFIAMLARARFLMTDGGSNQEEAAMMGIPTLLLRELSEREDGLGDNVTVSGLDPATIRSFVKKYSSSNWIMRPVSELSPSSLIADALEMKGGASAG